MAVAPSSREQRHFPRVPVDLTAHCRIGNRFVRDAVLDLSQGGLYLRTREPAREGMAVRIALALPFDDGPRYCTLAGSITRVDRDTRGFARGLGVCFAELMGSRSDREALAGFLSRRCAA